MAFVTKAILLSLMLATFGGSAAFMAGKPSAFSIHHQRVSITQQQCICIDCARVTNCKAYHFVETKHNQPHMNDNPVSIGWG